MMPSDVGVVDVVDAHGLVVLAHLVTWYGLGEDIGHVVVGADVAHRHHSLVDLLLEVMQTLHPPSLTDGLDGAGGDDPLTFTWW